MLQIVNVRTLGLILGLSLDSASLTQMLAGRTLLYAQNSNRHCCLIDEMHVVVGLGAYAICAGLEDAKTPIGAPGFLLLALVLWKRGAQESFGR